MDRMLVRSRVGVLTWLRDGIHQKFYCRALAKCHRDPDLSGWGLSDFSCLQGDTRRADLGWARIDFDFPHTDLSAFFLHTLHPNI